MVKKKSIQNKQLNEKEVQLYLEENPDFFIDKNQLLSLLNLPHINKGSISLVERQMIILREENKQQKNTISEFIATAKRNDVLTKKIQSLSLKLIATHNIKTTLQICHDVLTNDFKIEYSMFILFKEVGIEKCSYVNCINSNHSSLKSYQSFLKNKLPRCNKLTNDQYKFLFNKSTAIASSALIPLHTKKTYGFLAIASKDTERFNPSMSMDYLSLIGALISQSIERDTS